MIKMKFVKLLALVFVAFSLVFISSCGKKDKDNDPTDQEVAVAALTTGTWTFDATSTVPSSVDGTGTTVAFAKATESTVNFTFGGTGDLKDYASGGTLTISEAGAISVDAVTLDSSLALEGTATCTLTGTTAVTISFSTAAADGARTLGVGSFVLKFNKAE